MHIQYEDMHLALCLFNSNVYFPANAAMYKSTHSANAAVFYSTL